MELEKKVKIGGESYVLKLPSSFKDSLMIDQLKIEYSDGMYWELPKLGTPSAMFNWQLINVASYFDTMAPLVAKELAKSEENISVLDLNLDQKLELLKIYDSELYDWLREYDGKYIAKDEKEK